MNLRAITLGLLLTAFVYAPAQAWKTETIHLAKLKPGKAVGTYASPNRKATLLFRDEGVQGDFVWRSFYLKQGTRTYLLDAYQTVSKVKWSKDSKSVTWRAVKAIDYNMLAHLEASYRLGSKKLRWRILKREKVGT